jgi:hypothetical protein
MREWLSSKRFSITILETLSNNSTKASLSKRLGNISFLKLITRLALAQDLQRATSKKLTERLQES